MSEKITTENILSGSLGCPSGGFPENLIDLISFLNENLEKIPAANRHTARLVIFSGDGSSYIDFNIEYDRPESMQEMSDRKRHEAHYRKRQEFSERQEFERLNAKYGEKK